MAAADLTPYTAQHIKDALAHDARVGEMTLDIAVRGDKVFVTGQVPTAGRRDAIPEVVATIAPGVEVVNEVTVVPCDEPEGQEVLG